MLKASTEGVYFSLHFFRSFGERENERSKCNALFIQRISSKKEEEGDESAVEFNNAQSLQKKLDVYVIISFNNSFYDKRYDEVLGNHVEQFLYVFSGPSAFKHASLVCLWGTQFLTHTFQFIFISIVLHFYANKIVIKERTRNLMKELLCNVRCIPLRNDASQKEKRILPPFCTHNPRDIRGIKILYIKGGISSNANYH